MTSSTPTATPTPTALSDPEAYLSLHKFNRRLPQCPRTNLRVTFSDTGDPDGVPLLYLLPSGCSRWIAASMDPLAKAYGVRMIVVDRPGCGGTEQVPLSERIERSCEMIVSVLEHLNIEPAHILGSSAGVYYALHLLTRHPSAFATALSPPPRLYLIAPWSPLLPPTHPEYWPFKWDWIPTGLIATQHITTPHLIKAAENAQRAYTVSQKALATGRSIAMKWFKSIIELEPYAEPDQPSADREDGPRRRSTDGTRPSLEPATSSSSIIAVNGMSLESPSLEATMRDIPNLTPSNDEQKDQALARSAAELLGTMRGKVSTQVERNMDIPHPHPEGVQDQDQEADAISGEPEGGQGRSRLWGPCECCVSCLTDAYMGAENNQGIGQEHLVCLNRGPEETGAQWLIDAASDLDATIRFAQSGSGSGSGPEAEAETGDRAAGEGALSGKDDSSGDEKEGGWVPDPIDIHVWWGWQDDMVPRKGQLWFNGVMGAYPDTIKLHIHDVEDGDHTDLLSRVEGLHQVFEMVGTSRINGPDSH